MGEYEELRVRYWHVGGDRYFVLANGGNSDSGVIDLKGRDFHGELEQLFEDEFNGKLRPGLAPQQVGQLGNDLWKRFVPPLIAQCFQKCLNEARRQQKRLRLRFALPTALFGHPVEILNGPNGHLVLDQGISVVRSLAAGEGERSIEPAEKLTILWAGASPLGWTTLDLEGEVTELRNALAFQCEMGTVVIQSIAKTTRQKLTDAARKITGPCAVAISAHGKPGCVVLEDETGSADEVRADVFAGMLSAANDLRFVALNLCYSGSNHTEDLFSGAATQLVRRGVPVVSAFPFPVSDAGAIRFNRELLTKVGLGSSVDEAVASARIMMPGIWGTHIEWCGPTLHVREEYLDTHILSPKDGQMPPKGTHAEAVWIVRNVRRLRPWVDTKYNAAGALRRFPDSEELEALCREAVIEADLAPRYGRICEAIAAGRMADARREFNDVPHDPLNSELRKLLEQHAGGSGGRRTPDPPWKRLVRELTAELGAGPGICLIFGEPRTGKSWIAEDVAKRLGPYRDPIKCGTRGTRAVRVEIASVPRTYQGVVVLDDLRGQGVSDLLSSLTRVIVTSRRSTIKGVQPNWTVETKPLTQDEALIFFAQQLPKMDLTQYEQALKGLSRRMEGSIGALDVAAGRIRGCKSGPEILDCIEHFDGHDEHGKWRDIDVGE